jgi:hypothetical protein
VSLVKKIGRFLRLFYFNYDAKKHPKTCYKISVGFLSITSGTFSLMILMMLLITEDLMLRNKTFFFDTEAIAK